MYYIYKCTNKINNKSYIGQTCNLASRIKNHTTKYNKRPTVFQKAIQEYGEENFVWEILEKVGTLKESYEKEKFYINELNTLIPNGYNFVKGTNPDSKNKEKKIKKYDKKGNFIKQYNSISETCDIEGIHRGDLIGCLKHRYKSSNGYIWLYEDEEITEKLVKLQPIHRVQIIQYDKDWNEIAKYPSCAEAGRKLGLHKKAYKVIWKVLDKENKSAYGFHWKRRQIGA